MAKRVYFAFHYQDVIDFRVNVVRNHNVIESADKAGYYDASIWEEAKKKGSLALKRLINSELENTTVTAVLIGTNTYNRPWVRYEIFKSIERGNKVIGIHINGFKGKDQNTKPLGRNPFEYIGLKISSDGKKATPVEWNGEVWIDFSELDTFVINNQQIVNYCRANCGNGFQLLHLLPIYDWESGNGYKNFSSWIA